MRFAWAAPAQALKSTFPRLIPGNSPPSGGAAPAATGTAAQGPGQGAAPAATGSPGHAQPPAPQATGPRREPKGVPAPARRGRCPAPRARSSFSATPRAGLGGRGPGRPTQKPSVQGHGRVCGESSRKSHLGTCVTLTCSQAPGREKRGPRKFGSVPRAAKPPRALQPRGRAALPSCWAAIAVGSGGSNGSKCGRTGGRTGGRADAGRRLARARPD